MIDCCSPTKTHTCHDLDSSRYLHYNSMHKFVVKTKILDLMISNDFARESNSLDVKPACPYADMLLEIPNVKRFTKKQVKKMFAMKND